LTTPQDIIRISSEILSEAWAEINSLAQNNRLQDFIDDETLKECVRFVVNSRTKSYRYVLPTQLVAKLANSSLDCRCLQVSRGGEGAFDARSVASNVIVPFDDANERVLGGSPEPYVNKPLRFPEVSLTYRGAQKNKNDWDNLCTILNLVEEKANARFTESLFKQILTEIYNRLSRVQVAYPAPMRISLSQSLNLLQEFLSVPSGGDRLLALTAALFVVIGKRFQLYATVRRGTITTADAATGMIADLECVSEQDSIVLIVEVKDRQLTINQVRSKVPEIRQKQVSEIFFVAQQGISPDDKADIDSIVTHEFITGHNIYILDLISLGRVVLGLIGEAGRRDFLQETGYQLDEYKSDVIHRRAWAALLNSV